MMVVLAFAFVAGVLTILAPCTLPVVPLVLGASSGDGRGRIVGIFTGFGIAFVAVTVVVAAFLAALGLSTALIRLIAVATLGLVGLSLAVPGMGANLKIPSLPVGSFGTGSGFRSRSDPGPVRSGGFTGGLAIGAGIGLVWAPCVGPIMAAVIATAAVNGPSLAALLVATAYVAGASVPLAAIAFWGRRATQSVNPTRADRVRRSFGAAMALSAVLVLAGLDVPIQAAIASAIPAQLGSATFGIEVQPQVQEELPVLRPTDGAAHVPLEDLGPAPELTGTSAWINSPPIALAALRGKVVLVHFWTFGCINCLNVQPYVKAWYDRYAAEGFVVLGIHTPELSFERDPDNVRAAVAKDGVRFPVVLDPDFATWNAYRNSYWPAFYFVDKRGQIRHVHFGEGDYEGSEAVIRELLAEPA